MYFNKREMIDGYKFSSKKEMNRYLQVLKPQLMCNEISDLEIHPKFVLLDKFTDWNGVKHRAVTYSPDFKYKRKDGTIIIEEIKDESRYLQEAYTIKKKFFIRQHLKVGMIFLEVF